MRHLFTLAEWMVVALVFVAVLVVAWLTAEWGWLPSEYCGRFGC